MNDAMRAAELWTYPVQSLQGERRPELDLVAAGVIGERYFAIVDVEMNSVAHASRPTWKNIIKWRARWLKAPGPAASSPLVEIGFEDGETMRSDDSRLDHRLSERFGRQLRFVRNDGSVAKPLYQSSPCHFITSASLAAFNRQYAQGRFAPARFRPNLVIDCGEAIGFVEQEWIGRELQVGSVPMRVTEDCVRCALTTRSQGDLPMDAGILHTVQQANKTLAGAYADVMKPGRIREGEIITLGAGDQPD